jgi:hypothetical protein
MLGTPVPEICGRHPCTDVPAVQYVLTFPVQHCCACTDPASRPTTPNTAATAAPIRFMTTNSASN